MNHETFLSDLRASIPVTGLSHSLAFKLTCRTRMHDWQGPACLMTRREDGWRVAPERDSHRERAS